MTTRINLVEMENLLREMTQLEAVMKTRKMKPPSVRRVGLAYSQWQNSYKGRFVEFVHDCIDFPEGKKPYEYQDETLSDLSAYRRVAQYGLHGFGKTTVSAWIVLGAILMWDDVKIVTTASVWRQLTKYLWPEIKKWMARLKWNKIQREPFIPKNEIMALAIKRGPSAEAFAVASNQAGKIEGAHAEVVMFIYDESKIIPDPIWDASEGAFSAEGTTAYALASSTPGPKLGRFYEICSRQKGYEDWHVNHIDTQRALKAGAVSQKWLDNRKRQWGEESPLYKNRCLGEFADDSGNNVIPLTYVERAIDRYDETIVRSGSKTFGVDVARYGDDKSVIAVRQGDAIIDLIEFEKIDTAELVNWVETIAKTHVPSNIVVDVIGIGAGVFDQLRQLGYPVTPFNAAESTGFRDESGELTFTNKRSASWWKLRELLGKPDSNIMFPDHTSLVGELTTPTYKPVRGGAMSVEAKEDIRRRLHRSTDYADAVIMAYVSDVEGMFEVFDTEVALIEYRW